MKTPSHVKNMSSSTPLYLKIEEDDIVQTSNSETHLSPYNTGTNSYNDVHDIYYSLLRLQNSMNPISYVTEALNGNLMPAIILLERKQIEINSPININTGDTLLHLACHFSFYKVTRVLIEVFNADVNIQNYYHITPLHIICNNKYGEIILLKYLLNNESINIEIEDCNGLTPLCSTVINNFNIGFMCLISKGANVNHLDKCNNNVMYLALVHNNIFVINFLSRHSYSGNNNINWKFYSNTVTLSEMLITNKNIETCKQIVKYYWKDIKKESIEQCCKSIKEFPFYNRYNYEMLNTLLYFIAGDVKGFLHSMFPIMCFCLCKRKHISKSKIHSHYYQELSEDISYRKPNKKERNTELHLSNENTSNNKSSTEKEIIYTNDNMCYEFKVDNLKMFFIEKMLLQKKSLLRFIIMMCVLISICLLLLFSNKKRIMIYFIVMCGCLCYVGLFYCDKIGNINETKEHCYNMNDLDNKDNLINIIKEKIASNIITEFPLDQEICERCLILKHPTTFHCFTCDKCIPHFYFHSYLFNKCISLQNIRHYITTTCIISLFTTVLGTELLYNPTHISLQLIGIAYITLSIILFGNIITLLLCLAYNTSYHMLFNFHKHNNPYTSIHLRKDGFCSIPPLYNTPWKTIISNLYGCT